MKTCIRCGKEITEGYYCERCRQDLERIEEAEKRMLNNVKGGDNKDEESK